MTDNEIIKALECLCWRHSKCRECPYSPRYEFPLCQRQIAKDSLDLIKRQQEDIERLHSMNCAKLDTIHDLQANTDKLKKQLQDITEKFNCQQTVYTDLSKIIKDQKKEIAKVKCENEILSINADNLLKGTVGEKE